MNRKFLLFFFLFALFLQSCTNTFGGTVLVLGFRDIILYVLIAFVMALVIAMKSDNEKRKTAFWIWFIAGLIVTPLASFIYLLILFSRKK